LHNLDLTDCPIALIPPLNKWDSFSRILILPVMGNSSKLATTFGQAALAEQD
jgi:hypothetical protein